MFLQETDLISLCILIQKSTMNQRRVYSILVHKQNTLFENNKNALKTCNYLILGMRLRNGIDNLLIMDKLELIRQLLQTNPKLNSKQVEASVKVILDAMSDRLARGGRIEIRSFGSFSLGMVKSRQKRNVVLHGKAKVPMKYVPRFKAAKELRERTEKVDMGTVVDSSRIVPTLGQFNTVVMRNTEHPLIPARG